MKKTADEILKEQFGHAYGMLHPFEISRITSAMEEYASQFNKPPVYGQWIDINVRQPEYMEVVLIAIRDLGTVTQAQYGGETDHFSIGDDWLNASHWMPLPPSPGSVDVDEKKPILDEAFADNGSHSHWRLIDPKTGENIWSENPEEDAAIGYPVVDGLGDSSGSEKEKSQFREPSTQGEEERELIRKLQARCESVEDANRNQFAHLEVKRKQIAEQKAEIERLKQENERLNKWTFELSKERNEWKDRGEEQYERIQVLEEALKQIRHKTYSRDTDDAILYEIDSVLTEAGFPYQSED